MLVHLFQGMLIGFLVALPVGPIDMLCVRRTLLWGVRSGFITGMGAAFADAIYGALAAFGIITLTTLLVSYKVFFQILGGLFLCILGIKNCTAKYIGKTEGVAKRRLALAFMTTFLLALLSPMTIISFIGMFAVLGLGFEDLNIHTASMLTLGTFLGSSLWWLVLSSGVALFKDRFKIHNLSLVNKVSGFALLGCGIVAIFIEVT